jgi:predicted MFS family arabinose efflux permease
MLLAASAGQSSVTISPMLLGAIGRGFESERFGALCVAIEIGGMALAAAALVTTNRLGRLRAVFLLGAVLTLVGNALSIVARDPAVFMVARLLTGIGEGTLMAALGSAATRAEGSTALFAFFFVTGAGTGVVLTQLLPVLEASWGVAGLFVAQTALAAVALGLLVRPHSLPPFSSVSRPDGGYRLFPPLARGVLAGVSLLYVGNVALWTFLERIAVTQGLSVVWGARVIGLAAVCGIVSGGTASKLLDRMPLTRVFAIGFLLMSALSWIATHGAGGLGFSLSVLGHNAALLWLAPAHLALLARIDPSGRMGALAIVPITLGSFAGAILAATLTPDFGYGVIGIVGVGSYLVALSLTGTAAHRRMRSTSTLREAGV